MDPGPSQEELYGSTIRFWAIASDCEKCHVSSKMELTHPKVVASSADSPQRREQRLLKVGKVTET